MEGPDGRTAEADLAGLVAAHGQLLAGIAGLTDGQARAASRLPGWSVGHVLTHLARNADGIRGMLEAALRGEVADQYPGGVAQREADIDAGSDRPALELVADVRVSADRLGAAFDACRVQGWKGAGRGVVAGEIPVAQMPRRRWREVEIHHADLGLGFGIDDWSDVFVRTELVHQMRTWQSRRPMGLTDLPEVVLAVPPRERLAWLVGRLTLPGVADAGLVS